MWALLFSSCRAFPLLNFLLLSFFPLTITLRGGQHFSLKLSLALLYSCLCFTKILSLCQDTTCGSFFFFILNLVVTKHNSTVIILSETRKEPWILGGKKFSLGSGHQISFHFMNLTPHHSYSSRSFQGISLGHSCC